MPKRALPKRFMPVTVKENTCVVFQRQAKRIILLRNSIWVRKNRIMFDVTSFFPVLI